VVSDGFQFWLGSPFGQLSKVVAVIGEIRCPLAVQWSVQFTPLHTHFNGFQFGGEKGCGRGLEAVWKGCGRDVEGVWKGCGRGIEGVWKGYGPWGLREYSHFHGLTHACVAIV